MKKSIYIGAAIVMQAIAILINFETMKWGSKASSLNVLASILFLLFWVFLLKKSRNEKNMLTFSISFWALVLLTSIFMLIANCFEIEFGGVIIALTTLFLTPLCGLGILTPSYKILSIIYLLVSFSYVAYGVYSLKSSIE